MDSTIVNKEIRKNIRPLLKENGFTKFTARNAWRVSPQIIEVINFQSFNSYLAEELFCTTFSFSVNLGIYYLSVHNNPWINHNPPEFPKEYECHARRSLTKSIKQTQYPRSDIWFIDNKGLEIPRVFEDAKNVICEEGLIWFDEMSKLPNALEAFQNKAEIFIQKSIAIELLGGNLNSISRLDVVSGIALELGNIELAKSYLKKVMSNPFYARQIDSIKELEEKLQTIVKIEKSKV